MTERGKKKVWTAGQLSGKSPLRRFTTQGLQQSPMALHTGPLKVPGHMVRPKKKRKSKSYEAIKAESANNHLLT